MKERLRDPVFWSEVTQLVKTAVAASVAWVLAVVLVGTPQSFLAPWAALLVVHATVFRTFSQGARQVAGAVAGVLLAWSAGILIGPDVAALAAVVFLGLLIGRSRWLEGETTTAAATALVVLTTGFADDQHLLVDRLLDTGIGVTVGLVINVAVWPPLRRRSAIAAMDELDNDIGDLLVEVADGLAGPLTRDDVAGWVEATSTRGARPVSCAIRRCGSACFVTWSRPSPRSAASRARSSASRSRSGSGNRPSGTATSTPCAALVGPSTTPMSTRSGSAGPTLTCWSTSWEPWTRPPTCGRRTAASWSTSPTSSTR
jgi:Aromatic acid exporter family member 1